MDATTGILSIAMVLIVPLLALTRYRALPALAAVFALGIGSALLHPSILILQCILAFVFYSICVAADAEYRGVLVSSIAAWVITGFVAGALGVFTPARILRNREELRAKYPLKPLGDRLAYETQRNTDSEQAPTLSPHVETRLAKFEKDNSYGYRDRNFARIHDAEVDEFLRRQRFGVFRMRTVQEWDLQANDPGPIRFDPEPTIPADAPLPTSEQIENTRMRVSSKQQQVQLLNLHTNGTVDFLDPNRIGYVKDRDHVAGFISHRFEQKPSEVRPAPHRVPQSKPIPRKWRITRLELISLMKHKQPVAYLSEHLPRMDELKEARTRPLTAFETEALKTLRNEEDVVVREFGDRVLMVGAVRAAKSCLKCHFAGRGDLLGAFSYELFAKRPAQKSTTEKTQEHRNE